MNSELWPLEKKYFGAHFYLSSEKPAHISEAQRASLGALHLYVCYGAYQGQEEHAEFAKCTPTEKKKRIEEWTKLGNMSRTAAMGLFIDKLQRLCPSWLRHKRLYTEFEHEWKPLRGQLRVQKLPFVKPVQTKTTRVVRTIPERNPIPQTIENIQMYQKSRFKSYICKPPRLNAKHDVSDMLYNLKLNSRRSSSQVEPKYFEAMNPSTVRGKYKISFFS